MTDYRDAKPTDTTSLIQFQIAMAKETEGLALDPTACAQGVRSVFERPELGRYYVGELDGAVVASTLITYEWSDWRNGIVWWIQSVYVLPQFRRKGVYKKLYNYLQRLAISSESVRGIRLYVDRRNAAAQQVYEALGMNGNHYKVYEWMKAQDPCGP